MRKQGQHFLISSRCNRPCSLRYSDLLCVFGCTKTVQGKREGAIGTNIFTRARGKNRIIDFAEGRLLPSAVRFAAFHFRLSGIGVHARRQWISTSPCLRYRCRRVASLLFTLPSPFTSRAASTTSSSPCLRNFCRRVTSLLLTLPSPLISPGI